MTAPEPGPDTVTFNQLVLTPGSKDGPLKLWECGLCASLVRPEAAQLHAEWHGQLKMALLMASL